MRPSFDIDSLRTIVAGTDLGSFAGAAVQLGRSQSAVSMQLKKLEQQAGTALFVRKGRGLVPTEAGEVLLGYARRMIALNDEAALAVGATASTAVVRLGLPQEFFEDVMPATLTAFSEQHPHVHVDIRVGDNHKLGEEIRAGRLDGAIAFCERGAHDGELVCVLPMRWVSHEAYLRGPSPEIVELVTFGHPCLFRTAALSALEQAGRRWRLAVTTPSLMYIWSALRSSRGVGVRTKHGLPGDIVDLDDNHREKFGLPELPPVELRLLRAANASPAAEGLCEMLRNEAVRTLSSASSRLAKEGTW